MAALAVRDDGARSGVRRSLWHAQLRGEPQTTRGRVATRARCPTSERGAQPDRHQPAHRLYRCGVRTRAGAVVHAFAGDDALWRDADRSGDAGRRDGAGRRRRWHCGGHSGDTRCIHTTDARAARGMSDVRRIAVIVFLTLGVSAIRADQQPLSGSWGFGDLTFLELNVDASSNVSGTVHYYQGTSRYSASIRSGTFNA